MSQNAPGLLDNLAGAFDIMMGRSAGRQKMDFSASGIWWSFCGLILAGLLDISALSMLYNSQVAQASAETSKMTFILGRLFVAFIGYAASLIALFLLCRTPIEQKNFPVAVTVHNWAAPIVSLAFLPLLVLGLSLDTGTVADGEATILDLISVFWIGVLIFVGLRLLRISLEIPMGKAAFYFVVTAAVSIVTTQGLESMLGLIN